MGSESQFGCDKEKKSFNCFPADDAKMVSDTLAPVTAHLRYFFKLP